MKNHKMNQEMHPSYGIRILRFQSEFNPKQKNILYASTIKSFIFFAHEHAIRNYFVQHST